MAKVNREMTPAAREERLYGEVDVVLLHLEDARARAERALATLRAEGADDFLIEAMDYTRLEISAAAKRLTQRTFFAAPQRQLSV